MAALAFRVSHRCVLIFGLDDTHVARCAGGSLRSLCKQSGAPGGVRIVAADAVRADLQFPMHAGTHLLVAREAKIRDLILQLVGIGS